MRRALLIGLLLCSVLSVSAKIKVVDSSSKRAPEWYGGAVAESVVTVSVSDISLEDAKRRAFEQIKVKMVESIAQNISYTSFSKIEQQSGDKDSFNDEFKSALLLNTAKVPFISGISESKVEAFYWEVTENKDLGTRNYTYSMKYPLPHAQVEAYIREFENIDKEKVQELEMLESGFYSIMSVDEIGEAVAQCRDLEAYLFDATRKNSAATLRAKYYSLYDRITSVTQTEELGRAYVTLQIGDKKIMATQKPLVRYDKDLITNFKVAPKNGGFEISYDSQYCQDDIPYVILLSFQVGNKRINHEITFTKSGATKIRIQPQGTATLTAQDIKAESVSNLQFQLDLLVEGLPQSTVVTVDFITLRIPNLKDEFYCNKVGVKRVAANRVALIGVGETTLATTGESSGATIKTLSGEIIGYYGDSKTPFQSKFTRPYKCNW